MTTLTLQVDNPSILTHLKAVLDAQKRAVLDNVGYAVLVWHYATPLSKFIARYPDIFTPVN